MAAIPITSDDGESLWVITCISDTMSSSDYGTGRDQRTATFVQETTIANALFQVNGPRKLPKTSRPIERFLDDFFRVLKVNAASDS